MRILPRSPYVAAIIGAAVVVVLAWTGQDNYRMVGPGAVAPAFTASTLDGETAALSDYANRVVLLNIWATWCPPCREEMPSMERLYRRFQEQGTPFEVLAVSIDAAPGQKDAGGNQGGDLRAFAEEYGLTFTILHDPAGGIQELYQTTGVPESFLIGKDGVIYRRIAGAVDWDAEEWSATIARMLAAPSVAADSSLVP